MPCRSPPEARGFLPTGCEASGRGVKRRVPQLGAWRGGHPSTSSEQNLLPRDYPAEQGGCVHAESKIPGVSVPWKEPNHCPWVIKGDHSGLGQGSVCRADF